MKTPIFNIIAIGAIFFSMYSYLSPNSPKLYSERQMSSFYLTKSFAYTSADYLLKSNLKSCNFDYNKGTPGWDRCFLNGMKRIKAKTKAMLKEQSN